MFDLPAVQAAIRARGSTAGCCTTSAGCNVLARRVVGARPSRSCRGGGSTSSPRPASRGSSSTRIEPASLDQLPGTTKTVYRRWQELEAGVGALVDGAKRVAMEYSPRNGNPYIGRVDAGTIELVRSFGVEVVAVGRPDPAVRGDLGRRPGGDALRGREASPTSAYDVAWAFIAERDHGDGGRRPRLRRPGADHGPLRGRTA